jgi:hypothetical protein
MRVKSSVCYKWEVTGGTKPHFLSYVYACSADGALALAITKHSRIEPGTIYVRRAGS